MKGGKAVKGGQPRATPNDAQPSRSVLLPEVVVHLSRWNPLPGVDLGSREIDVGESFGRKEAIEVLCCGLWDHSSGPSRGPEFLPAERIECKTGKTRKCRLANFLNPPLESIRQMQHRGAKNAYGLAHRQEESAR